MQVSKYLYKHFAHLNCYNLNYAVKITSAVLLQYVKVLGFRALTLKFYGKPKRNNFSIGVLIKMTILFLLAFVLFKKLLTCNFASYFFLLFFSQKNTPFARGKLLIKIICIGIK